MIHQNFSVDFNFPIIFSKDIFGLKNHTLKYTIASNKTTLRPKLLFMVDHNVDFHHPDLIRKIETYCIAHDMTLSGEPVIVTGGEEIKDGFRHIEEMMAIVDERKLDRHSYIIAIGGGAVLDAVGWMASIVHRGIRLIRIPTTVLSQNDSGVGVKNGINAFGKKNFVGSFAPPVAVLNDADFLTTLNDRDWRSGISEAVKVSLIKDLRFFVEIERNAGLLKERDLRAMSSLVYRCAKLHADHISGSGDPFEKGTSRPLDFGHWAAHKLEQLTAYELRHGEAVAIGLALDVTYSFLSGMLIEVEWRRILALLKNLGFSLYDEALDYKSRNGNLEIIDGLEEFREHLGGRLTIMLIEGIGEGKEIHYVSTEIIKRSLMLLKEYQTEGVKTVTQIINKI